METRATFLYMTTRIKNSDFYEAENNPVLYFLRPIRKLKTIAVNLINANLAAKEKLEGAFLF